MNLGPAEIMVICVAALLVVGPARLPGLARKLGQGMRQFNGLQTSARDTFYGAFTDEDDDRPVHTVDKQSP